MSSLKTRKKKSKRSIDAIESAAARARKTFDPDPPPPADDDVAPLIERRRSAVEQARPPPPLRLLSKREVCARVGVSYPTIWKWIREKRFPRARVLNGGKIGWIESEVEAWILNLPIQTLKPADEQATR